MVSEGPVLPVRQPGPRGGEVFQVLVPLVHQSEHAGLQERDAHALPPARFVSLDTVHRVIIHDSCRQNQNHTEASGETHPGERDSSHLLTAHNRSPDSTSRLQSESSRSPSSREPLPPCSQHPRLSQRSETVIGAGVIISRYFC